MEEAKVGLPEFDKAVKNLESPWPEVIKAFEDLAKQETVMIISPLNALKLRLCKKVNREGDWLNNTKKQHSDGMKEYRRRIILYEAIARSNAGLGTDERIHCIQIIYDVNHHWRTIRAKIEAVTGLDIRMGRSFC
jgi:hypothetical protein